MNFLNPAVLFGMFAASIPLILHLLNLRKLKTIEFSTLLFIKELQKTKIRKIKIKQILLLILRTLIIAFVVFAFARPAIRSNLPLIGTYSKTSMVILIDNSFSMDVSDEFGNRFNQAKSSVQKILENLKDGDEVSIIPMSSMNDLGNFSLSRNLQRVRENLSSINISNTSANLENSLRIASSLLDKAVNLNKEIYVVSDAQPNIFHRAYNDSIIVNSSSIAMMIIPIGMGTKSEISNLSIDSVYSVNRIYQVDKTVEVETFIRNHSDKDVNGLVVSLFFNKQRVAQRTMDIQAGQTKSVLIGSEPQVYGLINAYVELENDAQDADNRRFFGFVVPQPPNIAVIGNPQSTSAIKILSDLTGDKPVFNAQFYTTNQTGSIDLSKFDVVCCLSGPFKSNDYDKLAKYVSTGGSLFIFPEEDTPPEVMTKGLQTLGILGLGYKTQSTQSNLTFDQFDKIHPLFQGVFKGTTDVRSNLETPKMSKVMTTNSGQGIIGVQGSSVLSEIVFGDGKIIFCGISPDMAWGNFSTTSLFPVLILRSISYLSAKEGLTINSITGENLRLILPKKFSGVSNFKLLESNGSESFIKSVSLPSGVLLNYPPFNSSGVNTMYADNNKIAAVVNVNNSPDESDLNKVTVDNIKKDFSSYLSDIKAIEILNPNKLLAEFNRARTGTELWQIFVILALICAITEMIVARTSKNDLAN